MSAITRYSADVEASEMANLSTAINGIAATIASAADIVETIIESEDIHAGNIAHGVAELLHLQNKLLGSLAAMVDKSRRASSGGAG
ncbi:hypothetical protein ACIPR8_11185 [Stenotrophomonas sp. LARHCG68]